MVPFQPGSHVRQRPSTTVHGCWPLHWPHLRKGQEAGPDGAPLHPSAFPPPGPQRLPTATAQAVEASGAWLATVLAPVARIAGARAVHRVAATAEALTIAIAAGAERALATLAAAALLLAGRRVAGALVVAAAAPPAYVAQAGARLWIASRSSAAVACASALSAPPARLAPARAAPWVACAVLALASMLAARAPAARVTRTLSGHVLALSVRVATAPLLAVGAPELARALCKNQVRG